MIYKVEIRKKVVEFGYVRVEAENKEKALQVAQDIADGDEQGIEWNSITEATEDSLEARNPTEWVNNTMIGNRMAIPVLQANGSYTLE